MKLFHGSPKKLKILKPRLAKGLNEFENQKAVFLTKTFRHAALYAIGKTLKGKTIFAITPEKLLIVGKEKPREGFVFEVEVEDPIKGPNEQFASKNQLRPTSLKRVYPKDSKIMFVETKEDLMKELK